MAAKRKRTKSKSKIIPFKLGTSGRKKKQKKAYVPSLIRILKTLGGIFVFALITIGFVYGLGVGFVFLDKYVKKTIPVWEKTATLKLIDVPAWVTEELKGKVYAGASAYGDLKSGEDAAHSIQTNLAREVAWLDEVKVQITPDGIHIKGRWRKPLALIKSGINKFYVDAEMVVLDFIAMPNLSMVRVQGLSPLITKIPPAGEVWKREDAAAAVAVLVGLEKMDELVTPDKPLLNEIESIDVSNFNGRQNNHLPHIVLYANDKTEIIWGAEVNAWQRHLESTDEDKLAKLYYYYNRHGTLIGGAQYINLRDPQDKVPLPIDKY